MKPQSLMHIQNAIANALEKYPKEVLEELIELSNKLFVGVQYDITLDNSVVYEGGWPPGHIKMCDKVTMRIFFDWGYGDIVSEIVSPKMTHKGNRFSHFPQTIRNPQWDLMKSAVKHLLRNDKFGIDRCSILRHVASKSERHYEQLLNELSKQG